MSNTDFFLDSLQCVEQAALNLNLKAEYITDDKFMLDIHLPNKVLRFWRNKNPFNDFVACKICRDKAYQAEIFTKFNITQPKNMSFHNPKGPNGNGDSISGIIRIIEGQFEYPIVAKKHNSSLAKGVYLAENKKQLHRALKKIFKRGTSTILVIQEFIPGREFRVVAHQGQALLAYEKATELELKDLQSKGDLNPLHSGQAVKVTSDVLLEQFTQIATQIHKATQANFCGIDLMLTKDGTFYVIEANAHPGCSYYNKANGQDDFIKVYQKVIESHIKVEPQLHQESQSLHIHQSHPHPPQSSQLGLELF